MELPSLSTELRPAFKKISADDWAGDRSPDVVGQMLGLQADVRGAFSDWTDLAEGKLAGLSTLPQVDVVKAATELLRWQLSWLELDNLLRETFYGEPALQSFQVIEAHLAWCSIHLKLTDDQFAALEQAVLPLAFKSALQKAMERVAARRKKVESAGDLWALAGPLPEDALSQALVTWLEKAAGSAGQEVLDAVGTGVTFNLPDTAAGEFLQEYALAFSARTAKGSEEKIRKVLLEAVAKGHSIEDARTAVEAVHSSLWQYESERIARTEIVRGHAEGQLAALTDLGIQLKTWLAAADERTCPICGPRDGESYPIDDETVHIPAHPHCRCTWAMDEGELARIREEILAVPAGSAPIDSGVGSSGAANPEAATPAVSSGAGASAGSSERLTAAQARKELRSIRGESAQERRELKKAIRQAQKESLKLADDPDAYDAFNRDTVQPLFASRDALRERELERMREVLYHPSAASVAVVVEDTLPAELQQSWGSGLSAFGRIVGPGKLDGLTIRVGLHPDPTARPRYRGSGHGEEPSLIQLMPAYPDAATVVHELGHWLEDRGPDVIRRSLEFYDRRTKGEQPRWLGPGYGQHEEHRPDEFSHKYSGYVPSVNAQGERWLTEIVSMGVEWFYRAPDDLAVQDRDYFDFIYGLLNE